MIWLCMKLSHLLKIMSLLKLFLILFFVSYCCFHFFIIFLKKKHVFQYIYQLAPQSHQQKKFTPSFGGIVIVMLLISSLFIFDIKSPERIWVVGVTTLFSLLGFLDDYLSKKSKKNKGLSSIEKFVFQCIFASISVLTFNIFCTQISLKLSLFFIFLFIATTNACNLTDGLDGLLCGSTIISLIGFCYVFKTLFNIPLLVVSISFICILCAFLSKNSYPARIMMGDTGSLAIGAFLTALACSIQKPFLLIAFGGLFIIETLSVMIQVTYFKWKKKRVFLMTPLHHHFECMGLKEPYVVMLCWLIHLGLCSIYFIIN